MLGVGFSSRIVGGVRCIPDWKVFLDVVFSVRSSYDLLSEETMPTISRVAKLTLILHWIWKSCASSKVQVFSWQLILDRILIRVNQLKRGVISVQDSYLFLFCWVCTKTVDYMFVTCVMIYTV